MNHIFTIPAALSAIALLAAACGGSTNTDATESPAANPSPTTTAAVEAVEAAPEVTPIESDGTLTLDYTAFIEGAIQPSGIGVDEDATMAAIVTDFERVVIVDLATQNALNEFGVGRNNLPRQGATEGIAFLDAGRVAVLYPDDRVVGLFDLDGEPMAEIVVETDGRLDGALTVIDGSIVVVARNADSATLLQVDTATGEATSLMLSDNTEPFEGLSADSEPGAVVAVTGDGALIRIDLASGAVAEIGVAAEVADPSGVEVFFDSAEGETQYGVTDDDDQYNAEPSPLRLFLA